MPSRTEADGALSPPAGPSTLTEALRLTAQRWPERGVDLYDRNGVKNFMSYAQLHDGALRVADALRAQLAHPNGERLLLAVPNSFEFIQLFFGAMLANVTPVPLSPPRPREHRALSSYIHALHRLARRLDARKLVVHGESAEPLVAMLQGSHLFDWVTDAEALISRPNTTTAEPDPALAAQPPHTPAPEDVAYIQLSSGTTGPSRGALLTHGALVHNVSAIGQHLRVCDDDIGVSWLPFFNDMGLVGVLFFSVVHGLPLVLLDPERFLRLPHEWLWTIANHKATLSVGPSWGYSYCARRTRTSDIEGLDLASWRVAMNGGEPIHPIHIRAFERRFKDHGLQRNITAPIYGLVEGTLAVTSPPIDRPTLLGRFDRAALERQRRAAPAADDDPSAVVLVSLGPPLPGFEVAVHAPDTGAPLPDGHLGAVMLRGPHLMRGYCAPDAGPPTTDDDLAASPADRWVETGDLGLLYGGDLYVLGHASDLIRLGERDTHPDPIEAIASRVDGVRPGAVAAFGVPLGAVARSSRPDLRALADRIAQHPDDRRLPPPNASALHEAALDTTDELLVVAVEVSEGLDLERLQVALRDTLKDRFDLDPDDLRILSPRSLPRTRSGKIQRYKCRRLYLDGTLDRKDRQARWQAISLITDRARSAVAQLGRRLRAFFDDT